jgi:hypothetical protein
MSKPVEKRGRKATGLNQLIDSRVARKLTIARLCRLPAFFIKAEDDLFCCKKVRAECEKMRLLRIRIFCAPENLRVKSNTAGYPRLTAAHVKIEIAKRIRRRLYRKCRNQFLYTVQK